MTAIMKDDHLKEIKKVKRKARRNYYILISILVLALSVPFFIGYDHMLTVDAYEMVKNELKVLHYKNQLLQILRSKPLTVGQALDVADAVIDQSARSNVPVNISLGVLRVESEFNPYAVSKKGAKGLMQIMPLTFKSYVEPELKGHVFDPATNMRVAIMHLGELYSKNLSWSKTLRKYYTGSNIISKDSDRYVMAVLKHANDFGRLIEED